MVCNPSACCLRPAEIAELPIAGMMLNMLISQYAGGQLCRKDWDARRPGACCLMPAEIAEPGGLLAAAVGTAAGQEQALG